MWPFHRHTWIEVERRFGIVTEHAPILFGGRPLGESEGTIITFKCGCNEYKQTHLLGTVKKET